MKKKVKKILDMLEKSYMIYITIYASSESLSLQNILN